MRELTKQQKIDFCNYYINKYNENYSTYNNFICIELENFLISPIKIDIKISFKELYNNFPNEFKSKYEPYETVVLNHFVSLHNSDDYLLSTTETNIERLKIIQKTLNDLLNENNAI